MRYGVANEQTHQVNLLEDPNGSRHQGVKKYATVLQTNVAGQLEVMYREIRKVGSLAGFIKFVLASVALGAAGGAATGALVGAVGGGTVGSAVPVIGTITFGVKGAAGGAIAGAIVGAVAGVILGSLVYAAVAMSRYVVSEALPNNQLYTPVVAIQP
ncbi:MAG: hypothetical protein V4492_08775 [Chlamydiota bacterium]